MADHPSEEASRRVLDKAEQLFLERGYAQTKLRDLAAGLNMKPASLYYHAPGGKEELWHRVVDRLLARHHEQLVRAAQHANPDLRSQLRAMGDWLISQPPVHPAFIASSNTNNEPLSTRTADRMYEGLMAPIADVIKQAVARGEIRDIEPDLLAGVFVTSVHGMVPLSNNNQLPSSLQKLVYQLIDIFMDGILAES